MPARVNKTLLLTIVGIVVVGALAVAVMMFMSRRGAARRADLLQSANEYRDKGQKTQEAFTLERMLLNDPKDLETRRRLARAREDLGQVARAYQDYAAIVAQDPLNIPALLKLALFNGQMGRWGEEKRNAKVVVDLQPTNAEARLRMAEACLGNGPDEYPEALEHARKAVEYNPKSADAWLLLARIYQARQEPAEVKKVLEDAKKPENVGLKDQNLWSFEASYHLRLGEKAEAEQALKSARENATNPVIAELQLGGFYLVSGNYEEAERHIQAACDNATTQGDRVRAFTASGDFYVQRDNTTMALKQYREALVAAPKARDVLLKTAQVLLSQKQYDEARAAIEEVKAQGGRDQFYVMALFLDGQRNFAQGRPDDAIAAYEQALDLQRTGDIRMATAEIQMGLAQAYLGKQNIPAAREALMKAYQEAPANTRVMITLARMMLITREYDQVIAILENAAKPFEGFLLLARAYMGRGSEADLREAYVQLMKARQVNPDSLDVHLDLARLAVRQAKFDDAVKEVDEALRIQPTNAEAWLVKAAVYEQAKQPKKAEETYRLGIAATPDNLRLRLATALFLVQDKRFDEGERLLLDDYQARPADHPLRKEYEEQIPRFYLAAGRADKALEWYGARAKADPKDARSRQAIALIYLGRSRFEEAAAAVEDLKSVVGPSNAQVLKIEGEMLCQRRQFKDALKKLLEAEKTETKDPDIQYYIGVSYLRSGDARRALEPLKRVSAQFPANARASRALAEAYYTLGEFEEAKKLAEGLKAAGESGLDIDVIIAHGEDESAWREVVQKNPERPEGYIGLADALMRQSKAGEAAAALEKAYALDPKRFSTVWSLANLYVQQKAFDKAVTLVRKALDQEPANLATLGLLARLYELSGKPDEALKVYEQVRKLDPGNPMPYLAEAERARRQNDLAGAEAAFRAAMRLKPDDFVIRKQLVDVLLVTKKYADANAVVDQALREKPDDILLTTLKAQVQLVGGKPDEAIRAYRQAIKLARDQGQEKRYFTLHYDLGRAFMIMDRLGEARLSFEAARDLEPGFVEARLALSDIAWRQERLADARAECLSILEGKSNIVALLMLGDIARRENNLPEARQYYERAAKEFPDASLPLRRRAEVLLREKKVDEALAELRKVVLLEKHDPEAVGLVTDVLIANQRQDEALTFLTSELEACPEPAVVYLYMGNVEASRKNYAKARAYYDDSINRRGDNARVYLAKAETYRTEKNTTRAIDEARQALKVAAGWEGAYLFLESLYREEKRTDDLKELYQTWRRALPDSVVAANNYAWFLVDSTKDADGAMKVLNDFRQHMAAAGKRFPFAAELDDTEGVTWFEKGDYRKAVESFERSLDQRNENARTWEHLRMAYVKLQERAKAQSDDAAANRYQTEAARAYNRVLQLTPASFESQVQIGDMRLDEGKVKEAVEAYRTALRLKKDADLQRRLAEILIRDGRAEEASPLVVDLVNDDPKDPGNLLLEGLLLSQTGKSDEAVSLLEGLTREHPDVTNGHYLLAMEYINRNDLDKAKASLDKVTAQAPKFVGARLVKARLLAAQSTAAAAGGRPEEAKKTLDEAIVECRAVVKGDPANFEAAYNLGNFLLLQNKMTDAENVFKDLVARWPDSILARERLAETYRRSNRLAEAMLEYQDARRRNSHSLLLVRGMCLVLQAQNKPDQMIREYAAFLEDNPSSTAGWLDIANLYTRTQQWGDVERALKTAVRTARTDPGVYVVLIEFYTTRNMLPEARDAARRLMDEIGTAEAKSLGRSAVARTYEREGKIDEAVKEYRAAIEVDPGQPMPVNNLAWLLLTEKKDPDAAIALAEPYLQKFPGFAELHDTVGWAWRTKGDYAKALPLLDRALVLLDRQRISNASIDYHYGETLYLAGKPAEAKKWLDRALKSKFPEEEKAREILKKIQ